MADGPPPPPPPPPHGTSPKSSGLPPGNYDIFIIPPHASGSGFLYLPSLQPNVNSFVAGFASALVLVALTFILKPLMNTMKGGGGPATLILMFAIGLGAWALGRMQSNGESRPGPSQGPGVPPYGGSYSSANNNTYSNGSASSGGPRTSGAGFSPGSTSEEAGGPPPNPQAGSGTRQRQRANSAWEETPPPSPDAGPEMPGATPRDSPGTSPGANDDTKSKENASRSAWEAARERTRRKEEERRKLEEEKRKIEAEKKRRADLEKRLRELRAKEALERAAREKRQRDEREARERRERDEREAKERKDREERESKEKRDREELEAREKREKAAREKDREERERLAKLEREDQISRERKAKEERETRERIRVEAEAKAKADYDRKLREEVARREVLRKEEEAIKKEQEKLRLEAMARVEADKKARADKERLDAEEKLKAEKKIAAKLAWERAKAAVIAKREAKAKEEREKEVAAQIREVKLKEEREKAAEVAAQIKEIKLKEERDRLERERVAAAEVAMATERRKQSTYSNAGVGERMSPWPNGKPPTAMPATSSIPRPSYAQPASPKKPPAPSARSYADTDKDTQFHSPYAQPPRPARKKSLNSLYSESSYAASQSTSRTTPPPSTRGAYSTKDPDKIVIKGVFAFNNAFHKTPTSQLLSGVGSVTDGLILRITTEGLFIDDDVRGVAQREWDVKAWTMKLVEVWCPSFRQASRVPPATTAHKNPVRRLWGLDKELAASEEEKDTLLVSMLQLCRDNCRARAISTSSATHSASGSVYSASSYASSSDTRSSISSDYADSIGSSQFPHGAEKFKRTTNHNAQMGENKTAGLHILRASIRDQEGKKYVFVVQESEAWKVALGLQRLRRGTQVRSLGVSGMSPNDAKATLENLGWI